MTRILHDWLASFQELPIEGVGTVRWHRQPAQQVSGQSIVRAPSWTLVFQEDPSTNLTDAFVERLSSFGQCTTDELRKQYSEWLQQFNVPAGNSVDLLGMGSLLKDSQGKWIEQFNQPSLGPDVSLDRLPRLRKKILAHWRWSEQLVMLFFLISLGWFGFALKQAGFRWGVWPLKSHWKTQPASTPASSYREIR